VTHGEAAIRALKQTTKTIPIVVGVTGDLVLTGHAVSLARPGGNITGLVDTSPELSGKRLELLKDILPKALRIAILWNAANRVKVLDFKETEMAAQALGLKLQSLEVRASEDFEDKFKAVTTQRPDALVVLQDALMTANTSSIVDFAAKSRLPAMYGSTEMVEVGGLMSYGERSRPISPRRCLRGQDHQGRQNRRSARRTADEVRVHHQSESSQTDRINHSADVLAIADNAIG
jgi:putative ABC transport system substrate-binding protein